MKSELAKENHELTVKASKLNDLVVEANELCNLALVRFEIRLDLFWKANIFGLINLRKQIKLTIAGLMTSVRGEIKEYHIFLQLNRI